MPRDTGIWRRDKISARRTSIMLLVVLLLLVGYVESADSAEELLLHNVQTVTSNARFKVLMVLTKYKNAEAGFSVLEVMPFQRPLVVAVADRVNYNSANCSRVTHEVAERAAKAYVNPPTQAPTIPLNAGLYFHCRERKDAESIVNSNKSIFSNWLRENGYKESYANPTIEQSLEVIRRDIEAVTTRLSNAEASIPSLSAQQMVPTLARIETRLKLIEEQLREMQRAR